MHYKITTSSVYTHLIQKSLWTAVYYCRPYLQCLNYITTMTLYQTDAMGRLIFWSVTTTSLTLQYIFFVNEKPHIYIFFVILTFPIQIPILIRKALACVALQFVLSSNRSKRENQNFKKLNVILNPILKNAIQLSMEIGEKSDNNPAKEIIAAEGHPWIFNAASKSGTRMWASAGP